MELRNALTKARLDILRPIALEVAFAWDSAPGPVALGVCPAGHLVDRTVVEIEVPFNNGTRLTVGDLVGPARLQVITDNDAREVNRYEVRNDVRYAAETALYLFFAAGSPTVGRGRVLVYLN